MEKRKTLKVSQTWVVKKGSQETYRENSYHFELTKYEGHIGPFYVRPYYRVNMIKESSSLNGYSRKYRYCNNYSNRNFFRSRLSAYKRFLCLCALYEEKYG